MKLTGYAETKEQILEMKRNGFNEVILCPELLSRFGNLSFEESAQLATYATEQKMKVFCDWDILPNENLLNDLKRKLPKNFLMLFNAVRIQDMGVLNYILKETRVDIHWIAETAHHNIFSLKAMENMIGSRLKRFTLSLELPLNKLKEFAKKLKTETEILIFGRILLFYSPRKLISPLQETLTNKKNIEITVNSEESPHRGFPVLQNLHGTFMFNPKDHCLLELGHELLDSEIGYFRIDLRHDYGFEKLPAISDFWNNVKICKTPEILNKLVENIKEESPRSFIRGFAKVNKTDHQFIKLKNNRIKRVDNGYVGQVLDVKKGSFMAIKIKDNFEKIKNGSSLLLKTPEGKEKTVKINKLTNSKGIELQKAKKDQIVFINHIGGISVRTAVFLNKEEFL